jgi:hypothetical protein
MSASARSPGAVSGFGLPASAQARFQNLILWLHGERIVADAHRAHQRGAPLRQFAWSGHASTPERSTTSLEPSSRAVRTRALEIVVERIGANAALVRRSPGEPVQRNTASPTAAATGRATPMTPVNINPRSFVCDRSPIARSRKTDRRSTANQVVAHNLNRAREIRGLTQARSLVDAARTSNRGHAVAAETPLTQRRPARRPSLSWVGGQARHTRVRAAAFACASDAGLVAY